ncbi:D-sedoheptulose 7-phosphate isomerase [Ilyomonas limi]|uniref:Phosphoheptose isomerase n=1 Tax=Ilyomonas limi TaxID=2575867 RepID=A0A4U3L8F5_9BACT|nr:D-sedoheptulose 7-phosphate isomerase [Ilyomonas limi]TKK71571.1 D-sedoheptulose 7-phosphate isomerase [Ilyomonas limi]
MKSFIQQRIEESVETKNKLLADEQLLQTIERASAAILQALKNGNKVLFCGNGGSAADAQHLAAEFSGRFYMNRKALPAEALHCNTSYLTAVANDYSFDVIYSRIIEGIGNKGDVLIGLSTSGNSKNIVEAFKTARTAGMVTIAFTGNSGGAMKAVADYLINIPSINTPRIQESHIMVGHIICEWVEQAYFQ